MGTKKFLMNGDETPTGTPAAEAQPADLAPEETEEMFGNSIEEFADPVEGSTSTEPVAEPEPVSSPAPPFILASQEVKLLDIDIDLVFVIDAMGSMGPFLDKVKNTAITFRDGLENSLVAKKRKARNVRAGVIAFRDYYCDDEPMLASRFFDLNDETDKQEFTNFVNGIQPVGGGDEPESSLEALYEAINSPWSSVPAIRRRQIIVLITDAPAHSLEDPKRYDNLPQNHPVPYPTQIPSTLEELEKCWMNGQTIDQKAKRLALYTPNADPWPAVGAWDLVTGTPTLTTMGGADEIEMDTIYSFITAVSDAVIW